MKLNFNPVNILKNKNKKIKRQENTQEQSLAQAQTTNDILNKQKEETNTNINTIKYALNLKNGMNEEDINTIKENIQIKNPNKTEIKNNTTTTENSKKEPIICFRQIYKKFKKQNILNNLNIDIYKNEIIGLLGTSGSGKSTFLKIFTGFYKADNGIIYYNKKNIGKKNLEIRKIIGFVSQENSFYEKLTVEENLIFFAKLYKLNNKQIKTKITELLDLVHLSDSKKTMSSNLSGGMKRRLEFAIGLIHNPKILILDEPLTGLDVELKKSLWDVIEKIRQTNVTIIISSHLIHSLQEHASRILILHNGKIYKNLLLTSHTRNRNLFDLEKTFLEVIQKWYLQLFGKI